MKTIDLVAAALFCARPTPVFYQMGVLINDATEEDAGRWEQWRLDVVEVETRLAANFPWFDRNTFLKACGYDP